MKNCLLLFDLFSFWIAYILIQQDVANMAKAYVHDICGYIDVANKENVRILSKSDLIWLILKSVRYFAF